MRLSRQTGTMLIALEQLAADLLFQPFDAARYGRMVYAQPFGSIHQALTACQFQKYPQIVPIEHVFSQRGGRSGLHFCKTVP